MHSCSMVRKEITLGENGELIYQKIIGEGADRV